MIDKMTPLVREPEWYAQEPFNPDLVAFRDESGKEWRYMRTALDETYSAEPTHSVLVGSLPPEEREVRDTLVAATIFRENVSPFAFWWSQFVKPTQSYRVSLEWFRRLEDLCARSAEHRAAFIRLSNSEFLPRVLRGELRRIVERCDSTHLVGQASIRQQAQV